MREIQRTGRVSIKDFYIRRGLRILPAYVCYLGVVFLMSLGGLAVLSGLDWTLALTYTVNFVHHPAWQIGHIWSLSIEEHFYLIWPLIMVLGGAKSGRRMSIAFIVFCFVARWVVLFGFKDYTQMAERWTFTRIDTISCGCLLALLTWDQKWRDFFDRICLKSWSLPLFTGMLLLDLLVLSRSAKLSVGVCYSLNSVLIALALWSVIRMPHTLIGQFLNHRLTSTLGVISYSLYLWQQIFLNRFSDQFAYRFPQNLVFVFVAAIFSYTVIERPFLRLKTRLAEGKHGAIERGLENLAVEDSTVGAELKTAGAV